VEAANREVRFVLAPDTDPRDALLPDVDLLVTRRRAALEHFAALADVRVTPLPWSRVYVVSATSFWPGGPSDEVLHELADQVLGASARPAESAILDAVDAVPEADTVRAPGRVPIPASRTLVAPAEDADAVALAERIASRWARDIGPVIVTPRDAAGTAQAAARGEAPVVLALARGPATVAHQRRRIEALAPEGAAPPRPLVVTRATLVSRADVAGVTWGYDGVPRLDQVRRLDAAP
jgi:hypothetical protein